MEQSDDQRKAVGAWLLRTKPATLGRVERLTAPGAFEQPGRDAPPRPAWRHGRHLSCLAVAESRTDPRVVDLFPNGLTGDHVLVGGCRESASLGLPEQRDPFSLDQRLPTFRRGARGAATGGRALSAISKHPPGYLAPTSERARSDEGVRAMSDGRFAGVDWASEEHAVCVVDENGRIAEGRRFRHTRRACGRCARGWCVSRSGWWRWSGRMVC